MSSAERSVPGQVISDGFYNFKFGANTGPGGMYLTAGPPNSQATAAALRPYPDKTQEFHVIYDSSTGAYHLMTDGQHGVCYRNHDAVLGQAVITSNGPPHEFTFVKVAHAAEEKEEGSSRLGLYSINVFGGPLPLLGVGLAPEPIIPTPLQLVYASDENTVWQLFMVAPGGEDKEVR